MSTARVLRFLAGTLVAAILLAIILPVLGLPASRYLPPGHVWNIAKGYAKGQVEDKFYKETSNPFNVGAHLDFADYAFYAKTPLGAPQAAGTKGTTLYRGQISITKEQYDAIKSPKDTQQGRLAKSGDKVSVLPGQYVRVRYDATNPEINGTTAISTDGAWVPLETRSVTGASATFSGWLVWIVVAIVLGYVFMLLLERFSARENI